MSVSTFQDMSLTTMSYSSVSRTTSCDIMCTSNTEVLYRVPMKGGSSAKVHLPYEASTSLNSVVDKKCIGSTLVEKYRHATNQEKRNLAMRKEKKEFFAKMDKEKQASAKKRDNAAVQIQRYFRGYLIRRPTSYIRRKAKDWLVNQNQNLKELKEELCNLSDLLGLKPINGLSLNNLGGRKSRRRMRIEHASCITIQCFVRVILAREVVKTMRNLKLYRRNNHAAKVIQKFFRFIMRLQQAGALIYSKRMHAAILIQTRWRIYLAKESAREMKKFHAHRKRQNEACLVIILFVFWGMIRRRIRKKAEDMKPALRIKRLSSICRM